MADQNLDEPEVWRPAPSFPSYEVSNLGRVKRVRPGGGAVVGRILRPGPNADGYLSVVLCEGGVRRTKEVHRLVCEAFHGAPPSPAHEAAHGNGVPADCRDSNLRWATRVENFADMARHGTRRRGREVNGAKLSDGKVMEIRLRLRAGERRKDLAAEYGVSPSLIDGIAWGTRWKHVQI